MLGGRGYRHVQDRQQGADVAEGQAYLKAKAEAEAKAEGAGAAPAGDHDGPGA